MKSAIPSGPFAFAIVTLAAFALAGCNDEVVNVEDGPPAVPTGVTSTTGDGQVRIDWNPVREADVSGYGVYRSFSADGQYDRIATVRGGDNTSHVDRNVTNGVTYYYAVDAFDAAGHESALSYENVFDTPRPAGTGVLVYAAAEDPAHSGLDLSSWANPAQFVTGWNGPNTDLYIERVSGVLYARGTFLNGYWNDIQDLGWTQSMDDVSWAPPEGWSVSPNGVELIKAHTYVVWTSDFYYAKFRIVDVVTTSGTPSAVLIDWAYQIDQNNPELSPLRIARVAARAPERGAS
ncbi:MAG: hypothetical protein U0167_06475 [bacterium]